MLPWRLPGGKGRPVPDGQVLDGGWPAPRSARTTPSPARPGAARTSIGFARSREPPPLLPNNPSRYNLRIRRSLGQCTRADMLIRLGLSAKGRPAGRHRRRAGSQPGVRNSDRTRFVPVRVRPWFVAPGVSTDNRGSSRTLTQRLICRLGSSTGRRYVPYNDDVSSELPRRLRGLPTRQVAIVGGPHPQDELVTVGDQAGAGFVLTDAPCLTGRAAAPSRRAPAVLRPNATPCSAVEKEAKVELVSRSRRRPTLAGRPTYLPGHATRVPQAAVTSGIQRSITVTRDDRCAGLRLPDLGWGRAPSFCRDVRFICSSRP